MLYSLSLSNRDTNKGWLLQILTEDTVEGCELSTRFRECVYANMFKQAHWFHQGTSKNWQMFEFWTSDQDIIFGESVRIAEIMHLELVLGRDPRENILIDLEKQRLSIKA